MKKSPPKRPAKPKVMSKQLERLHDTSKLASTIANSARKRRLTTNDASTVIVEQMLMQSLYNCLDPDEEPGKLDTAKWQRMLELIEKMTRNRTAVETNREKAKAQKPAKRAKMPRTFTEVPEAVGDLLGVPRRTPQTEESPDAPPT